MEKAKAEILICEKKLSDIREIQISNEVRYKKIKEKIKKYKTHIHSQLFFPIMIPPVNHLLKTFSLKIILLK